MGEKLEAVSNCGLHKIFLLLPFFNIDSRKLFCFSCLFAAGDFGGGFLYFLFVLLEWGKRDSMLLFPSFIMEIFSFSFCLKLYYLLYNFSDGTCHERDYSCRLKGFKIICGLSHFPYLIKRVNSSL